MTLSKVFGIIAGVGSSAMLYHVNTVQAKEMIDCHECNMKRLPKAHELPIYEKEESLCLEYDKKSKLPLLSEISLVRQQVSGLASYFKGFKEQVVHIYETGVAHSQSSYDYIVSEENRIPRILAILSGGFVGYLFARKRGIFKKVVFISTGCGIVCTAFYPALSKEYASIGWEHAKYHTFNALEKYGGYDTQKLSEEANQKIEQVKNSIKIEGLTNQLKELYNKNKEIVSEKLNLSSDPKKSKDVVEEPTKDAKSS